MLSLVRLSPFPRALDRDNPNVNLKSREIEQREFKSLRRTEEEYRPQIILSINQTIIKITPKKTESPTTAFQSLELLIVTKYLLSAFVRQLRQL